MWSVWSDVIDWLVVCNLVCCCFCVMSAWCEYTCTLSQWYVQDWMLQWIFLSKTKKRGNDKGVVKIPNWLENVSFVRLKKQSNASLLLVCLCTHFQPSKRLFCFSQPGASLCRVLGLFHFVQLLFGLQIPDKILSPCLTALSLIPDCTFSLSLFLNHNLFLVAALSILLFSYIL